MTQRDQITCLLPDTIDVGQSTLDPKQRRVVGGGMTLQLRDNRARELRALFVPRKRRSTFLTAPIDEADVSLTVKDGAQVTSSPIYIGAEAITWTSVVGNTVSGLTRGAYGSAAQAHYGGSSDGAGVYLNPPSWKGRKCWLKAVYVNDNGEAFSTDEDEIGNVGTFVLSNSPQVADTDLWTIQADDPIVRFSEAKAYTGQREVVPVPGFDDFVGGDTLTISGDDLSLFEVSANPIIPSMTKLLVTFARSGARGMFDLLSVGLTLARGRSDGLIVPGYHRIDPTGDGVDSSRPWSSLRHVAILSGDPAWTFLTVLLSVTGDGTNHALFDSLPGKLRAGFQGEQWMMGAGVPVAEVDWQTFLTHRGNTSLPMWVFLDRETSLMDLASAYTLATRTFLYVGDDFALTCGKLRDRVPPSTAAEAMIVQASTVKSLQAEAADVDEGSVFYRGTVRANYDPLQNKYLGEFNIIDWEIQEKYPNSAGERVIESQHIAVDVASYGPDVASAQTVVKQNAAPFAAVEMAVHRLQQNNARPQLLVRAEVTWSAVNLRTGQVVLVSLARVPDLQGGVLSSSPCRIVGRRPNVRNQTVELVLQVLDDGYLVAPAHTVSSWNAGTKVITFRTDDAWSPNPTEPTDEFAVGWDVWVVDTSPSTWVWSKHAVAALPSATTLTLGTSPAFVPAAGDLVILAKKAGETATNANGFTPDDYLFMNNDDGTDDTGAESDVRWS